MGKACNWGNVDNDVAGELTVYVSSTAQDLGYPKFLCTRHDHPGEMRLSSLDDREFSPLYDRPLGGEVACYGESAFCKVTTRHTGHNAEYALIHRMPSGADAPR